MFTANCRWSVIKFISTPFRFAIGFGISPRILSVLAIAMLVMLRLTIGWHFYSEGFVKKKAGDWTATPFFANASGPLSGHFREMVWDYDGKIRLDRQRTLVEFARFRDRVAKHYRFDEQQKARSQDGFILAAEQHDWILSENAGELEEFILGRKHMAFLDDNRVQKSLRSGVDSLGGQREATRREWLGKGATALKQIDLLWNSYEESQNALATEQQVDDHGYLKMGRPSDRWIDTSVIDGLLPYFDMTVGILLLFGLFTPVAALAAAGFLGSVVLSQYPPATGPTSSIYQLIECLACFVLASTGAGRFAGLDFFLHMFVRSGATPIDEDDEV